MSVNKIPSGWIVKIGDNPPYYLCDEAKATVLIHKATVYPSIFLASEAFRSAILSGLVSKSLLLVLLSFTQVIPVDEGGKAA